MFNLHDVIRHYVMSLTLAYYLIQLKKSICKFEMPVNNLVPPNDLGFKTYVVVGCKMRRTNMLAAWTTDERHRWYNNLNRMIWVQTAPWSSCCIFRYDALRWLFFLGAFEQAAKSVDKNWKKYIGTNWITGNSKAYTNSTKHEVFTTI